MTTTSLRASARIIGALLLSALVGCGGGGGAEGTPPDPAPTEITGTFFPLAVGDLWTYADQDGAPVVVRATQAQQAEGQAGVLVTVDAADGREESVYLVSAGGVRMVPVRSTDPIVQAIGPVDVLRFPLHAGDSIVQFDGTVPVGTDFDGDGQAETASVRAVSQVIGQESVVTAAGSFPGSLHVRTTIRAVVRLTGLQRDVVVDITGDDWYAPDIGPVRSTMRTVAEGMDDQRTYGLTAYRVGPRVSDATAPTVQTLSPADGTRQRQATSLEVGFSEAMEAASLAGALTVTDAQGQAVTGTTQADGRRLVFWPDPPLGSGRYTARLAGTATDLFGNPMGSERSWQFEIDATGPQVVAATPAFGATDVTLQPTISVRYDEPLSPPSLNTTNVALQAVPGGSVPISVQVAGDTVTVVPAAALARGTAYQLVIGSLGYGPMDLLGNLAPQTVLPFTTDPGRFGTAQPLQPDAGAEAVALGDVNGDGRRDVVVAVGHDPVASQAFRLAVYHQGADGRLAAAPQWIALRADAGCRPTSLAIGDVNGDGREDVVVAEYGCGVEVMLQGSDGVLRSGTFLPSAQSHQVRLADFNADGRLDLVAAGWSDVQARLWLQSAAGQLEEAGTPAIENNGWGLLAAGDLDGDGRADIAVTSGQGDALRALGVALQRADGSFAVPMYAMAENVNINPGVAIGDVDGDGRAELVAVLDGRATILRVENGALVRLRTLASTAQVAQLVVADVNGDGRLDIVAAHSGGCGIGIVLQQPGGGLADEVCYPGGVPWPQQDVLAVGDINGDGRPDIVTSRSVLLQRAVERFASRVQRPGTGTAAVVRRAIGAATR